jgi:hypothetical protein
MKVTQQAKILRMLRVAGKRGVTSNEFLQAHLPRFSARILELRKRGYRIESERGKVWRYRLVR